MLLRRLTRLSSAAVVLWAASFVAPAQAAEGAAAGSSQSFSRDEARAIIADARRLMSPRAVEELRAIEIGGIPQWISVRGRDRRNPILLFIHGGPASTEMPVSWLYQGPWENFFTVVQWDQRGAG